MHVCEDGNGEVSKRPDKAMLNIVVIGMAGMCVFQPERQAKQGYSAMKIMISSGVLHFCRYTFIIMYIQGDI